MIKNILIASICVIMLACSPKVDENGCLPNTVQGDDMCATDKVGVPEQAKEFCIKNPNALQCS